MFFWHAQCFSVAMDFWENFNIVEKIKAFTLAGVEILCGTQLLNDLPLNEVRKFCEDKKITLQRFNQLLDENRTYLA